MDEHLISQLLLVPVDTSHVPWTAIEPDRNLIGCIHVFRRPEPEEELVLVAGVGVDGQCACVRLACIEVDVRNSRAIDSELCLRSALCPKLVLLRNSLLVLWFRYFEALRFSMFSGSAALFTGTLRANC